MFGAIGPNRISFLAVRRSWYNDSPACTVFYMLFQWRESCMYTKYILYIFCFVVLQNIPVVKAIDMVQAVQGEEQSLGIMLL